MKIIWKIEKETYAKLEELCANEKGEKTRIVNEALQRYMNFNQPNRITGVKRKMNISRFHMVKLTLTQVFMGGKHWIYSSRV